MMNHNEWPLVLFTMLSQISAGILVGGLILWVTVKNTGDPNLESLKKVLIITAIACMFVALAFSFFHLGNPLQSVYALSNLGTSWLSKEIILASIYLFSLLLCYISLRYDIPHRSLFPQLFIASLVTGIIFLYAMSRVYMIPTAPLWNTAATPIAFFTTALVLGGGSVLVILGLFSFNGNPVVDTPSMQTSMFYLISAGVFILLLNMLLIQPDISSVAGSFLAPTIPQWLKTFRIAFLLAGFSLLTYWFAFILPKEGGTASLLMFLAIDCLLISEVAGRYIFYVSYFRVGI